MLLDPRQLAERLLGDATVTADEILQADPESLLRELRAHHREQLALAGQAQRDERYRAIVESAQDGVIVIDTESRIQEFNPAAERIFGFRKEEAIGQALEELIVLPEHRALHRQGLQRSLAAASGEMTGRRMEVPARRADGEIVRVELSISRNPGQPVTFTSFIRDITEQHRAAGALAASESALRESEQQHRVLLDRIPDPLFVYDRETLRYLAVNDAAIATYGYSRDEFLSMTVKDIRDPAEIPALLEMLATVPGGYQNRGQWRHLKRDGTPIDVEITAHDLTFDNRSACVVLARDVTQRKRVEAELLRNREQLRVASRLSRVGAWRVEIPSMTISWSEEMHAIFEVDPENEISLAEAFDFYEPQSREVIGEAFEACCREGQGFDSELLIMTAKGNPRWVRAIGEAVRDRNGDIRSVQGACQDISESRRTQARILELSTRLSDTLEKISDALITLDPEWNFTFINRKAEQLLHRDHQELLGKNIWEQFPEAVGSPFEIHYRRAMKDQVTVSFEQYFAPLRAWLMVRAYPTPDALAVYFQDITEIRQAEQSLRESDLRFREMAENIQDVFYNHDLAADRTEYISPAYETVWGRSCESLYRSPHSYMDPVIETDRPTVNDADAQQRAGRMTEIEYRIRRPDNEIRWIRDRAYPILGDDGRTIRVVGSARDITEQKLAEAAAREATERFRALAQATNDAIWDWDLATNRVWWNEEFATLFGYQPEDVDSTSDFWVHCIHPDDRESILSSIHRAQQGSDQHWSGEYRFRRRDGRYAFVLDRGYVIRDPQGIAVRMIGGMTDLTAIKRIEEELTRSNEDLQQFAYVASHDLQEPLRAVSGCVQLLKRRYGERLDAAADELISHTVDGVQRMRTLIHDLLEYSRLGTHDQPPRPTDLAEVLNTVLANLDHAIDRSQADITCDPLPTVIADRGQMVLLFQNLIANAIKFRGQERPRIHIGAVAQSGNWRLSIKDNGIGIKSDYFDRIFILFQRLHTRDEFSGTGIGLAMCKKIVDRHGGQIWVESPPGDGSCFFFTIPDYRE